VATVAETQPPSLFADPRERPFSARQLLEMDACTRCGECLRACSSFAVKGEEGAALMGMIRTRRRLFEQDAPSPAKLLRRDGSFADEWAHFQEGVFACTLCGRCEEFCPVGIRTRDLALTMRQELAGFRCMMPGNLELARQAVAEERNVFRFPNEDRALWAEFLDDIPTDLLTRSSRLSSERSPRDRAGSGWRSARRSARVKGWFDTAARGLARAIPRSSVSPQ